MAQEYFGTDLHLLRDLLRENDRFPGSDVLLTTRPQTGQTDLDVLTGPENLQQALLLRFLTRQGDLEVLGHPTYGSRLYTLIGELNNDTNRNRAKLFVLEALGEEPRVDHVVSVDVQQRASDRTAVDIHVSLVAVQGATPLNFVFPFFLGGPG